jgi:hypothetical protein
MRTAVQTTVQTARVPSGVRVPPGVRGRGCRLLHCHRSTVDAETLRQTVRQTVRRLNAQDEVAAYSAERTELLQEHPDIRDVAELSSGELRRLRAFLTYIRLTYTNKVAHLTDDETRAGGLLRAFFSLDDVKVAMTAAERIDAREMLWMLVDQFPAQAPYIVDVMNELRLLQEK